MDCCGGLGFVELIVAMGCVVGWGYCWIVSGVVLIVVLRCSELVTGRGWSLS